MKRKNLMFMLLGAVLLTSFATASTLYYTESCPHCQEVLNSGELFKIDNLKICPLSDDDCMNCYKEEGLKGVPALITDRQSIGGSKNIIKYAKDQPYFSKIPEEQDEYIGTHSIDEREYKLYKTPSGDRFLGGYK